jgi:hypothetical protein
MARRRWLAAAAVVALGLVLYLVRPDDPPASAPVDLVRSDHTPVNPPAGEALPGTPGPAGSPLAVPHDPARVRLAESLPGGIGLLPESRGMVASLHDPREEPETDLAIVENLLALYRGIFGGNPPGGLNREIVAAMLGANDRRLAVIPPDLAALSPEGELLDRWGSPFLFHPVSRDVMEVMSAGPDQTLWTSDDVGRIEPVGAPEPPNS